jgi:hypothetical protein
MLKFAALARKNPGNGTTQLSEARPPAQSRICGTPYTEWMKIAHMVYAVLIIHSKLRKGVHLQMIMLSETSQAQKDKYHMISLICVIQKS